MIKKGPYYRKIFAQKGIYYRVVDNDRNSNQPKCPKPGKLLSKL